MTPILGIMASQISGHLSTNSYESIATVTGSGASVTFSSIPNTYKHLQIRALAVNSQGANGIYGRYRVGAGSVDTGSNYTYHYVEGNGSAASAAAGSTQSFGSAFGGGSGATANTSAYAVVLDILDYQNTNKYKTHRALWGVENNGSGEVGLGSGLWMSTSAIDIITIYAYSQGFPSTFAANTQFALYGVKG